MKTGQRLYEDGIAMKENAYEKLRKLRYDKC